MKLKRLLKNVDVEAVKGSKEIEITGVCSNSRVVAPGNIFIAKKGLRADGAEYILEALDAGASAVVTELFDPTIKHVTQVIHQDVAAIEALIAAEYYEHPSKKLLTVGITGTNGKTTTAMLVKHLFDSLVAPCGLIGTIEYIIGDHRYPGERTTPESTVNQKLLKEMVLQNCQEAVLEVTSHGLDQGRVDCIDFDVAVFTNLSQDHLDYHGTIENYAAAKKQLFTHIEPSSGKKFPKAAIVNVDDSWHQKILEECSLPKITYGINSPAEVIASDITFSLEKTSWTLEYQGRKERVSWSLIGEFNIYNGLAAAAVLLSQGVVIEKIAEALSLVPSIPGRLEAVPNDLSIAVYVDFAHTPDALEKVLKTLRVVAKENRIITLFGCGGDRDKDKRPIMGNLVASASDVTVITSDNPRSEDPKDICQQIFSGCPKGRQVEVVIDRQQAIAYAVSLAKPGDIVLIAGKGHESQQVFARQTVVFDDRQEVARLCNDEQLRNFCLQKGDS